MPSATAAFLFTTNSYSVEVSTGSSPGLAPFQDARELVGGAGELPGQSRGAGYE